MGDGEELPWPSHTDFLDFELELGFVLSREVADATPAEGAAAIGGFFVVNDWSARDVQAHEYREGMFGPAVKSKSFATGIGSDTADVLDRWDSLRATARVNGETWTETSTAGAAHSPGDLVAYASRGERLGPGDVFAMGTVPGGCGLELDRWLRPGDEVRLEIEGVGIAHQPGGRARVKRWSLLALAGTAGHHGFERWAGVGMVLEPLLGAAGPTPSGRPSSPGG